MARNFKTKIACIINLYILIVWKDTLNFLNLTIKYQLFFFCNVNNVDIMNLDKIQKKVFSMKNKVEILILIQYIVILNTVIYLIDKYLIMDGT